MKHSSSSCHFGILYVHRSSLLLALCFWLLATPAEVLAQIEAAETIILHPKSITLDVVCDINVAGQSAMEQYGQCSLESVNRFLGTTTPFEFQRVHRVQPRKKKTLVIMRTTFSTRQQEQQKERIAWTTEDIEEFPLPNYFRRWRSLRGRRLNADTNNNNKDFSESFSLYLLECLHNQGLLHSPPIASEPMCSGSTEVVYFEDFYKHA